jgi:hypothetical protein
MTGPECHPRQVGESPAAYTIRLVACFDQLYSVCVGSCRYVRAPAPFRAADVLGHIANCARPLPEVLAVWYEGLSERYPYEWWSALRRVREQGGPSLNPEPVPWVEVGLKTGLGWNLWIKVQRIARGWLARRQLQGRLRKWPMHLGGTLSWGLLPARSETSGGMSYAGSGNRQGPPRTGDNTLGGGLTQIGVGVEPIGQGPQDCPGLVGTATALGVAPPKVADAPRAHVVVGSASRIPEN